VSQLVFDERTAAQLEVMYRKRDVLRRRQLVRDALGVGPGHCVLDVGCGPGFYAAELLELVGPSGSVVGIDASAAMLAAAARRCEGRGKAEFREAQATSLPVESDRFDRALSVQVLEYVADVPAALAEIHRALRPGGRAVIWDIDWSSLSWHSADPERMARVLRAWDRHLAHPALPRTLAADLRAAGFVDVRAEPHGFASVGFDPETYGAMMLTLVESYVAGLDADSAPLAKAWADEQRALAASGDYFFCVTQFCFTAARAKLGSAPSP
jgi:ubiquinone/menaquinone biosynthesis C-methylase UbiE